jgi:hypothetical protein
MQLEIGPGFRDYSPPPVYQEVTERHRGQARIGPDGSLEDCTAKQPFPMEEIDCQAEQLLESRRVTPGIRLRNGFDFRYPSWPEADSAARTESCWWRRRESNPRAGGEFAVIPAGWRERSVSTT